MYTEFDNVCANDKRIYDKAPVNNGCGIFCASLFSEIPQHAKLLFISATCSKAECKKLRCDQVPMRPLLKRVMGYINLPLKIIYECAGREQTVLGSMLIEMDVLARIPDCADYEFRALVSSFCAKAAEVWDACSITLKAEICSYLCVLVETPRCCPPKKPSPMYCCDQTIYPDCSRNELKPLPPICPPKTPLPCSPPRRPLPCAPMRKCTPKKNEFPCSLTHVGMKKQNRFISTLNNSEKGNLSVPNAFYDESDKESMRCKTDKGYLNGKHIMMPLYPPR